MLRIVEWIAHETADPHKLAYRDVLVLAVSSIAELQGLKKLWLGFEQDHNFDILQLIKWQDKLDQNKIFYSSSISCFDMFGHHVCVIQLYGHSKCMECFAKVARGELCTDPILSGSEMNITEVNKYANQPIYYNFVVRL